MQFQSKVAYSQRKLSESFNHINQCTSTNTYISWKIKVISTSWIFNQYKHSENVKDIVDEVVYYLLKIYGPLLSKFIEAGGVIRVHYGRTLSVWE